MGANFGKGATHGRGRAGHAWLRIQRGGECEVTSDYDYDEEGGDDTDLLKKHDVGRWAARKQLARHLGRSQDPGLHEIDDCDEREDAKQCADKNDKRPSFSPPL